MKHLNKAHRAILNALTDQPLTKLELKTITEQSPDGLRGRISEMRKMGYDIKFQIPDIPEKKYYLISLPEVKPKNVDKLLAWLDEKKLFSRLVSYSAISTGLGISLGEVEDAIAETFKTHYVTQMSKDTVKIRRG